MFSGRRSARSDAGGVLGAGPASEATGDGLRGSAMAKTRSSISGKIPVLPEQIPVAATGGALNVAPNRCARPALSRNFLARHPERSEGPRKVRTPSELSEVPHRLRGSG